MGRVKENPRPVLEWRCPARIQLNWRRARAMIRQHGRKGRPLLTITLFIVAFASLFFSKRLLGDYFSPPAIYTFFWAFALGCFSLNWVAFDPLRSDVWTVFLLSYAGFMGGSVLVLLTAFSKPLVLQGEPRLHFISRQRFQRALLVLFLLGIFGFLVQLAHLQSQLGLGTFLNDPTRAREMHSNVKYLGFFNLLNVANFVLALLYLAIYKRPAKWVLLILIWALATTFVTTDRTRFFYMVIWAFYVVVFAFRRFTLTPKIIGGITATVIALFGFFLLVAKLYEKEAYADNAEFIRVSEELSPLVDPYIYLTGSFPVFQAFMEDTTERHMGRYTFGPVVKLLETVLGDEIQRADLVGKFYRVPIELNACTYLEPFYKDFGIVGIILGPFAIGLLCGCAYVAMRQRKTLFSIYFCALLSFCVTIAIFVNHFTQIATWFFVMIGYVVYRYCTVTTPQPLEDLHPRVR